MSNKTTTKNRNVKAPIPWNTYWAGTGQFQAAYDALAELVPVSGEVPDAYGANYCLDRMRRAVNCYYDVFNNGLCNRAGEFRTLFGFDGNGIVERNYKDGDPEWARLEHMMNGFIAAAATEQGLASDLNVS